MEHQKLLKEINKTVKGTLREAIYDREIDISSSSDTDEKVVDKKVVPNISLNEISVTDIQDQ